MSEMSNRDLLISIHAKVHGAKDYTEDIKTAKVVVKHLNDVYTEIMKEIEQYPISHGEIITAVSNAFSNKHKEVMKLAQAHDRNI